MKLNVLTLALVASAAAAFSAANAQTVIEEHGPPAVVEHDHPSVTIEKREAPSVGRKTITKETTGSGDCTSKTVHKEDDVGSKTVHKTNCD